MLAGDQATRAVEGQAVAAARGFAEDFRRAVGRYFVDAVGRNVAEEPVAVPVPDRAFDKLKAGGQLCDIAHL